MKYPANSPERFNLQENIVCTAVLKNGEYYEIYAADTGGNMINSLQTTAKTVQYDNEKPTMELKYYTDSSRTTEVVPTRWSNKPVVAAVICNDTPRGESVACSCAPAVVGTNTSAWSIGVPHGTLDIGADLLRYTRTFVDNFTGTQSV